MSSILPARRLFALAFLLVVAAPVSAQDALSAAPHRLPFASSGHALELAVGTPGGKASLGVLDVVVAEAPPWLAFAERQAPAAVPDGEPEPVARLAFDVAATAPVGVPAEIVLHVVTADGTVVASHTVRVEAAAPDRLALAAPRPNPARGGTVVLGYAVPQAGPVRLVVLDALGREVAVLVDAEATAGGYEARVATAGLAAGVYAVRLVGGGTAVVRRLTVVR